MFGLFAGKKEKLEKKYKDLMNESYHLSTVDRTKSDQKLAEAQEVLKELERMEDSGG